MGNSASKLRGERILSAVSATAFCLCVFCSATVFAAEGGEAAHHAVSAVQLKDFGWRLLNFSIIFALLAWAVKKANVKGLLASRQEAVRKALEDAAEAREAAEEKYLEYSEKLETASQEIDEIYAAIKRETAAEKERILAEARATAERIREQAAASSRQEVQKAMTELREEAARLSVELAARTLGEKVGAGDQDRFLREFIDEYLTKAEKSH